MNTDSIGRDAAMRSQFGGIARRIGRRLRDIYPNPESEPLPADFAQKLLELRQKERARGARS